MNGRCIKERRSLEDRFRMDGLFYNYFSYYDLGLTRVFYQQKKSDLPHPSQLRSLIKLCINPLCIAVLNLIFIYLFIYYQIENFNFFFETRSTITVFWNFSGSSSSITSIHFKHVTWVWFIGPVDPHRPQFTVSWGSILHMFLKFPFSR